MTSLPLLTVISAALPSLAPISSANAFGTRNARLLPHFWKATFMFALRSRRYNVDTVSVEVKVLTLSLDGRVERFHAGRHPSLPEHASRRRRRVRNLAEGQTLCLRQGRQFRR